MLRAEGELMLQSVHSVQKSSFSSQESCTRLYDWWFWCTFGQ